MSTLFSGLKTPIARMVIATLLLASCFGIRAEEAKGGYDQVSLSTTTETQVPREIIIANLYARSEGPNLEAGSSEVNRAIASAIESARKVPEVTVATQEYQTEPTFQNQKPSGWVVQQGLRIESRQPERLARLLGELQKTLKLGGIDYAVAPDTRKTAEDRLITEGLKAFQQRAERITKDLGRSRYRIVKMDVGVNPMPYRNGRPMARAMAAEVAPSPALEAGETTLTMTVQGTIELQPN